MAVEQLSQRQNFPSFFTVALIEPEIPSNTGNIGRTCVASQSQLDLIGPLGFQITDKQLKRAGLDYWPFLKYQYYDNLTDWLQQKDLRKIWFFSVRGENSLYNCSIRKGDILAFGKETKGLPQPLLRKFKKQTVQIPFQGPVRSLNLSNAVAIALFEALRKNSIASTSR
ncbi:MAG: tRNA (cytidine(34)-2'-O)-methyltransferase [Oligoflexia bacterium]|nr:tRNA (cytidine(34)-2'-O)-methyltransferase [Oligoflexia bacterium]